MATSQAQVKREAEAVFAVCNEVVSVLTRVKQVLAHNSDVSVDWGNGDIAAGGADIGVDANGNITDLLFSPAQVSNAIGSLDQLRKCLENEAVSQGDHLGNLNLLARPLG